MSSIEKLLIRGFRSFDPNGTNVIEFYSPLTLIVGHNGSGKTTIIECLKYACTGDSPPNSKGGAFIHDPKVAHETEVLAQVKLKFHNVNGRQMVCTRSIQVLQQKNKLSVKTLESSLLAKDPETGEQVSISARCADIDSDIPLHLGASQAILDNVIFCHQEESFWPLSESGVLKKKFDEIFASTKYTRALDNIKTLRKEQSQEIREDRIKLDHLQANKEKAEEIRSMLETTRVQIDTYKNSVGELDMKIGSLTEELEERMEKQQKYQDIVSSIKELEGERARLTKSQDDLAPYFELLLESKQELDRLMDQHTSKLAKHDGTKYELEKRMNRKSDDLNQLRSALTKIAGQKSVMQAELEAHNQEILKRDEVIRMISRERNFKGYESSSFSSEDVRSILAKLKAQVEERESRVERIKTDLRKQECGITENLTALNKTLAAHVEGRRNARSQMDSNRQKIERLKEQLNKLEVSEAELGFLQNKLRDEERALNDASTKRDSGDMEAMLDAKRREKSQVDDQIKRFHDEIRSLTQQVDTRAKLELMRSDMEKKSGEISETLESCKKDFKACVGHDPTPQNMMHDINQLLLSKNRQIRTCEDSSEKAKRELTSISTKLKSANASLQRKSRQRGDIVAAITPVCNNQDLPSVLAEIETGLMDVRDQYAGLESAASLYGKFKQKSEKDRNCALCTRAFSKQVDLESFVNKLRSLIDRVPVQKLELERNIEDLERRRDELREMRPQWDTLVRLNEIEIPEHNHEIEEQERRKLVAEKDVKETATEMEILKEEIKSITDLRKQAENIARIDKEKKKIGSDIRQLEQDLRISGSTKTIDDCQRECGELQIRSNNIQRELEELNKENLAMERDISVKTNRRHVTRGKLTDLEHSFAERDRLQREIEQFHDDNKIQANKEKSLDAAILEIEPDIGRLSLQLQQLRAEAEEKERVVKNEIENLKQGQTRVNSIEGKIQRFIEIDGAARLAECESQFENLERQIEQAEIDLKNLTTEISLLEKQVSEVESVKRNIEDNIRHRENQSEIEGVDRKLAELEHKKTQYDYPLLSTQIQKLKQNQSRLFAERSSLDGELKQLAGQAKRFEKELEADYKNVYEVWREQLIELKTLEMASNDLNKYSTALDSAIARYHSMKMEEINKIIKELWINTYQGNDIDRIEIRSDRETKLTGLRSYNYRVVMIKGDVELDMRGRCSAGQKVLTSILIRLALAETFCINCGILALDEPTTNLDRNNIESLARSLTDIIKTRRRQRNFQLIIITHDEDFLSMLRKGDHADYYWRVSKDHEQHSIVERQMISD